MTVAVWDVRVGKSHALAFNAQKDVNVISSNSFFSLVKIYRIATVLPLKNRGYLKEATTTPRQCHET